jgi:hypothetical protein
MTVETIRPEALELIADQAAGKITEEQLLDFADQVELTSDELEAAQQEFDRSRQEPAKQDAEDAAAEVRDGHVDEPEPSKESVLADLKVLRESEKGSAKAALTRQINKLEAEIEASRPPATARKIKFPERELQPILEASKAHAATEPKTRRVYFANVDTVAGSEENVKPVRSWAIVVDGEHVGTTTAVKVNGQTSYVVQYKGENELVALGDDKNASRKAIARKFNGEPRWRP